MNVSSADNVGVLWRDGVGEVVLCLSVAMKSVEKFSFSLKTFFNILKNSCQHIETRDSQSSVHKTPLTLLFNQPKKNKLENIFAYEENWKINKILSKVSPKSQLNLETFETILETLSNSVRIKLFSKDVLCKAWKTAKLATRLAAPAHVCV